MIKKPNLGNIGVTIRTIRTTIYDLGIWLFVSFLLPLVQLLIMKLAIKPFVVDVSVYNILFVTIASFLTGVFFMSDFWKRKRGMVRMMLIISYIISFGLFTISLIQILFKTPIFDLVVYKWGVILALLLAVFVGFFSKYDENQAASQAIVDNARNVTEGTINGKHIKI